ncbi:MAG: retroviral-like aspartic protease family protein, partial [Deltaproteobacteria bacterium]
VTLDVAANGDHVPLVLDSGATYTVLDGTTARRLGVVPTGEAPFYMQPPWLPAGETWVGLLDHVEIAGLPVDGMHVLVMENLGVTGLLGLDFFRRVVVDIDMPHGVVRISPPEASAIPPGALLTALTGGTSIDVPGEVARVGRGGFTLDTGAMLDVNVYGTAMEGINPRAPGSDVSLGDTGYDTDSSPDYVTEVDGLRFAGLRFPQMPAIGRDRDRRRVGTGLALVGMGLLRHVRVLFDLRQRRLAMVPGDGYVALNAYGITVDQVAGRPVVSRVVRGSAADLASVREGDRVVRVNGGPVGDARGARTALAAASQRTTRLALQRDVEFNVRLEPR